MVDHLADVQRYDGEARPETVERIVRHLGVALRNRDSSLVFCSDDTELERIKEKWCEKKLGAGGAAAEEAVARACETMAGDRNKSRVTFYYLCARQLGKLDGI